MDQLLLFYTWNEEQTIDVCGQGFLLYDGPWDVGGRGYTSFWSTRELAFFFAFDGAVVDRAADNESPGLWAVDEALLGRFGRRSPHPFVPVIALADRARARITPSHAFGDRCYGRRALRPPRRNCTAWGAPAARIVYYYARPATARHTIPWFALCSACPPGTSVVHDRWMKLLAILHILKYSFRASRGPPRRAALTSLTYRSLTRRARGRPVAVDFCIAIIRRAGLFCRFLTHISTNMRSRARVIF